MKSNNRIAVVLSSIAICTVIGLCLSVISCSNEHHRQAIESVLEQDKKVFSRKSSIDKSTDIDEILDFCNAVISDLRGIDLSACPDDFATAYSKHRQAWCDRLDVYKDIKSYMKRYNSTNATLEGLAIIFLGKKSTYDEDARKEQVRIVDEEKKTGMAVDDTYYKVLEIASKYGVRTSKYLNLKENGNNAELPEE